MQTTKALRSMIRGKDPLAWMVAADMVGEQGGDGDQIGAAIRRRASRVLAVCEAISDANRTAGKVTLRHVPVAENVRLQISGGLKILIVIPVGPRLPLAPPPRVGCIEHVQRGSVERPDYLHRRATQIVDGIEGQR